MSHQPRITRLDLFLATTATDEIRSRARAYAVEVGARSPKIVTTGTIVGGWLASREASGLRSAFHVEEREGSNIIVAHMDMDPMPSGSVPESIAARRRDGHTTESVAAWLTHVFGKAPVVVTMDATAVAKLPVPAKTQLQLANDALELDGAEYVAPPRPDPVGVRKFRWRRHGPEELEVQLEWIEYQTGWTEGEPWVNALKHVLKISRLALSS